MGIEQPKPKNRLLDVAIFAIVLSGSLFVPALHAYDQNCVWRVKRTPEVEFSISEKRTLWRDLEVEPLNGRITELKKSEIGYWPKTTRWNRFVTKKSDRNQRLSSILEFPLVAIVAKPGHSPVRSPQTVHKIANSIEKEGYKSAVKESDRPSFNIITDSNGLIQSVESVGGHHRFLAQMMVLMKKRKIQWDELSQLKVSDLFTDDLDIYVNGYTVDQKLIPGKFPAHALDFSSGATWSTVRSESAVSVPYSYSPDWLGPIQSPELKRLIEERKILLRTDKGAENGGNSVSGELLLDPSLTNEMLGSRETLGTVLRDMMRDDQPKIAYVQTRGQTLPSANQFKAWDYQGYEEILFVPTRETPQAKAIEIRELNKLLEKQGLKIRANLYTSSIDYNSYVSAFGVDSFKSRLRQIYYTTEEIRDLTP